MKIRGICAIALALTGAAWLIGCKGGGVSAASGMSNLDCSQCHSGNSSGTFSMQVLANEAAYANSGHYNGLRKFNTVPISTSTGNIFSFGGSNAMRNNGATCSQCHTGQGFVSWVTTGTAGDQEPASPPGCFTCHNPHETGNFSLRTQSAVTLIDGVTTYDHGAGNLCVNCHHSRTAASGAVTGSGTAWKSSNPHHGAQSDFISGANFISFGGTYQGVSPHATATADSCVSCHKFDPASGNLSGTLQLGGHGFYLTGQSGTAQKDITALCKTCHTSAGSTFPTTHSLTAASNWASLTGSAWDELAQIRGLRDRLLVYFYGIAPVNTAVAIVTGSTWTGTFPASEPSTLEWYKDFTFAGSSFTFTNQAQAQAFWNLQLFLEDRSNGIHNPRFAAQILWDSISAINAAGGVGTPSAIGPRP
jgi:hypothetical protein